VGGERRKRGEKEERGGRKKKEGGRKKKEGGVSIVGPRPPGTERGKRENDEERLY